MIRSYEQRLLEVVANKGIGLHQTAAWCYFLLWKHELIAQSQVMASSDKRSWRESLSHSLIPGQGLAKILQGSIAPALSQDPKAAAHAAGQAQRMQHGLQGHLSCYSALRFPVGVGTQVGFTWQAPPAMHAPFQPAQG